MQGSSITHYLKMSLGKTRAVDLLVTCLACFVIPQAALGVTEIPLQCTQLAEGEELPLTREDAFAILLALGSGESRIASSSFQLVPSADPSVLVRPESSIRTVLMSNHSFGRHVLSINSLLSHRPSGEANSSTEWTDPAFDELIAKTVRFVTEIYGERREAWPPEFIEKLRALAIEYRNESTYINIEVEKESGISELIASVRLIREKNGLIPMEKYLGFRLKSGPDEMKVEPGNYAIKSSASDIGTIETSIGIITQTEVYQSTFGKKPLYATYADAYSERLHAKMGMKYVTADMIEDLASIDAPYTIDEETGAIRIHKDGVVWTPMYATGAMFVDMLETRFSRIADKRGGAEMKMVFQGIREVLASTAKSQEHVITCRVRSATPAEMVGRMGILKVLHSGPELKLSVYVGGGIWLTDKSPISVPWPLPEGYHNQHPYEHGIEDVSYNNNVLRVERHGSAGTSVFVFQIDSFTNQIYGIHHEFTQDGKVVQQYDLGF